MEESSGQRVWKPDTLPLGLPGDTGGRRVEDQRVTHRLPPCSTHSPIPAWRALYLDGLAEAALSQHLPVDEVRRPEDAVRPADHTEGLGATQVLVLGGRGAQRAGARGPVDAAAPPGGTHPVPAATRWAPGRGPLGGRAGLGPAPFPLPAMPHRCQSTYSHLYSQKGQQRTALLGQS